MKKEARQAGETYKTVKGENVAAHEIKQGCGNCKFKCRNTVHEDERVKIFEEFWKIPTLDRKWDCIARHVKKATT